MLQRLYGCVEGQRILERPQQEPQHLLGATETSGKSRAIASIRYAASIDGVQTRKPTRLRSNPGRPAGSYRSVGPRTTNEDTPALAATSPSAHGGLASRGATTEKRLCLWQAIQQSTKAASHYNARYRVKTNTIASVIA